MTGGLDLNADVAHFSPWNQPAYSLSAADSTEFYWNPTDAAALPANRRFTNYNFDTTTWDRVFPVAINSWVYARPMKYVEPLPGVPLGQYRYDQHCFIPAQYTGMGTGVWFIPTAYFMTPGFYYGSSNALMTDFWPSGRKKWYSHYQREDNKAWAHLDTPIPEFMGTGGFGGQVVCFSEKYRLVVSPLMGTNQQTGLFDCSHGVVNGTWTLKPSVERGYSYPSNWAYVKIGKSALSNGHPRNRSFMVWFTGGYSAPPVGFNILDLDDPAFPTYKVMKSNLKGYGENYGLHYVPSGNKFYLFGASDTAYCQAITIPDDLSDTAAYVIQDVPLSKAVGVDMTSSYTAAGFVQYVENLDCFVFMAVNRPAKAFFVE
jgi:hypothetical protein